MTMTLTDAEIKWLLTSPDALRAVANYNDWQESMTDSMGMPCSVHKERREWFREEAKRIEAEWDAEREPEQRVFLPAHLSQPAQAVDALVDCDACGGNVAYDFMDSCWKCGGSGKLTRALSIAQADGCEHDWAIGYGVPPYCKKCGHPMPIPAHSAPDKEGKT